MGTNEKEIYARKVCFGIGVFGIFLLTLFNWNFHLMFSGKKYESKVLKVHKHPEKCYQVEIEFTRVNGELVQKNITDCTGETFLFWIDKGETLKLWESKSKPYKHYVPFVNFAGKIFLMIFFIIVPFIFAIFGRY